MNRSAANPLMITTGEYWLIESSTAGDCLANTGARKPKFPVTAIRYVPIKQLGSPPLPAVPSRRVALHKAQEGPTVSAPTRECGTKQTTEPFHETGGSLWQQNSRSRGFDRLSTCPDSPELAVEVCRRR